MNGPRCEPKPTPLTELSWSENVASASSNTRLHGHPLSTKTRTKSRSKVAPAPHQEAPPGLLRCLILSWSEQRAASLQEVAERESWEAIISVNSAKFLKQIFSQQVPLTLIDLPGSSEVCYEAMREVTKKAGSATDSLLVICSNGESELEELWAREIGVWTYLSTVTRPAELDWIFVEARRAVAKQASSRLEHHFSFRPVDLTLAEGSVHEAQETLVKRITSDTEGGEEIFIPLESRRESNGNEKKK